MASSTKPLRPERVRRIQGSFTFVPSRFLHDGFLASLTLAETALYLFLLLASNRQGVSRYHYDRICDTLGVDGDTYIRARDGLIVKDLIAFDGNRFQVLSLPERPVSQTTAPPSKTIKNSNRITHSSNADREQGLQNVRDIIASLDR